jgi:predicted DNA-binding transcriptional regulator YafY
MKTSGWYDVQKWILSFGADARVLEPEHLRDKVRNEVEKMLKGYAGAVK